MDFGKLILLGVIGFVAIAVNLEPTGFALQYRLCNKPNNGRHVAYLHTAWDESYTRIDPECIKHYANRKL